jgi:hypothetical protein
MSSIYGKIRTQIFTGAWLCFSGSQAAHLSHLSHLV